MNPIDLLRQRQAQNRLDHARKQAARSQPRSSEYRYVGYDAEQGKAIVSNGSDNVSGNAITNGLIKPNQPVKVTQANRLIQIDAMPRPKPKTDDAIFPESYPIKILTCKWAETDVANLYRIELYVISISLGGKTSFRSRPIYQYFYGIAPGDVKQPWLPDAFAKIDSTGTGIDDWIVGFKLFATLEAESCIATITPQKTYQLSVAEDFRVGAFLNRASSGFIEESYCGQGFWSIPYCRLSEGNWQAVRSRSFTSNQLKAAEKSFAWHNGELLEASADLTWILPNLMIATTESRLLTGLHLCETKLRSALIGEGVGTYSLPPNLPGIGADGNWIQTSRYTSEDPTVLGLWGAQLGFDPELIADSGYFTPRLLQSRTDIFALGNGLFSVNSASYIRNQLYLFAGGTLYFAYRSSSDIFIPRGTQAYADLDPKRRSLNIYTLTWQDRGFTRSRKQTIRVKLPVPDDHLMLVTRQVLGASGTNFVPYLQLPIIGASYYA